MTGYLKYVIYAYAFLFTGSLIYVFFRQEVFFMSLISDDVSDKFYVDIDVNQSLMSYIMVFCLPDALWYLALLVSQLPFVRYGISCKILFGVCIVIPFVLELFQYFNCIAGTFDIYDVIIYVFTLLVFLIWERKFLFRYLF